MDGPFGSTNGRNFTSFLPAISNDALHKASAQVRSFRLHRRTGHTLPELAHVINPIVRGWLQYYGAFYSSALHPLLMCIIVFLLPPRPTLFPYTTRNQPLPKSR